MNFTYVGPDRGPILIHTKMSRPGEIEDISPASTEFVLGDELCLT